MIRVYNGKRGQHERDALPGSRTVASAYNVMGIDFYKKIGAEIVENKGDRFLFQADTYVIGKLLAQLTR